MVYKGDSVREAVSTGKREAGGGSPVGGLLVIQTEVMRAVAMRMEKRTHPKEPPRLLFPRGTGKLGENIKFGANTCCILSPRCSSSIFLFLPFRSGQTPPLREAILERRIKVDASVSSHHFPLCFLYCNFMICDFLVYSLVCVFIVSSARTVNSTVLSTCIPPSGQSA